MCRIPQARVSNAKADDSPLDKDTVTQSQDGLLGCLTRAGVKSSRRCSEFAQTSTLKLAMCARCTRIANVSTRPREFTIPVKGLELFKALERFRPAREATSGPRLAPSPPSEQAFGLTWTVASGARTINSAGRRSACRGTAGSAGAEAGAARGHAGGRRHPGTGPFAQGLDQRPQPDPATPHTRLLPKFGSSSAASRVASCRTSRRTAARIGLVGAVPSSGRC